MRDGPATPTPLGRAARQTSGERSETGAVLATHSEWRLLPPGALRIPSPPPPFVIALAPRLQWRRPLQLLLALLLALCAPLRAGAVCSNSNYSYGSGACAICAAGASFVSAAAGCTPSETLTAGPTDTALYLSGSQAEGIAAFTATGAVPTYAVGVFGATGGALVLTSGTHLDVAGMSAPAALPSGGNIAWSASAWVKCAAPATWAGMLEWGAAGDVLGAASMQAAALVVAGSAAAEASWGTGGVVSTIAGTGAAAIFSRPYGVAVIPSSGVIVVSDSNNNRICLITSLGVVSTLAGSGSAAFANGVGVAASFSYPQGIAVIPSSGVIVIADTSNHRIRLVDPSTGVVTTLAGSGSSTFADGTNAAASFSSPVGVAVIPSNGVVVVADTSNQRIRLVTPLGVVTTLAGSGSVAFADGTGALASFFSPQGVAVIPSSGVVVVADSYNNRIRLVTPLGVVTTLAGSGKEAFADGTGTGANFYSPYGIAVIPWSSAVVVADSHSNSIRLITPLGIVTTLSGSSIPTSTSSAPGTYTDGIGMLAGFNRPTSVALLLSAGMIVVADSGNNHIRLVTIPQPPALAACDSIWHHVALIYAPLASPYTLSAFLDGALAFHLASNVTLPIAAASTLRIGWSGDSSNNSGSLFVGLLAELRIYSRTLSLNEVVALSQPPLAAYANAAAVPNAPSRGAVSYGFSCSAGSSGSSKSQIRGSDGAWFWAGGAAPSCTPCAAGSFSGPGLTSCAPCYPGTYSLAGASSCSLCPIGTFGDRAGLTSAACSGACASCTVAGSTSALQAHMTCSAGDARAVPFSLGLQIWPAANTANPRGVDLLVAPLALCQQMTSIAACGAAASVVGADGVTRFVVGTAAAFNVEPAESLSCGAG